jgi:hypothetical protein
MPSAAKYHEVTLYILRMLLEVHEQELMLESRRLRLHFIEPINTVHKGIAKAKAELLKLPEHHHMINYRLYGERDYKAGDIVFRIEPYTRDINRVAF